MPQHQRRQLVRRLAADPARHLLLVTATPHSGKEEAFRSLLSLLNPDFAGLPETLTGPENAPRRRRLAAHIVQRRRADIRHFLQTETPFPQREEREVTYSLSPVYRRLFDRVLRYIRETVTDPGANSRRRRVWWWSALALLRGVSSSPTAAAAALRNRTPTADAENLEDVEDIGRRFVFDVESENHTEGVDTPLGSDVGEELDADVHMRRRLLEMAREAGKLEGEQDAKLLKAVDLVRELLAEGYRPILFCRFIPTADYVARELRHRLPKDVEVAAVTSTLPPADREARVSELVQAAKRVLVCTDCLSEGINLQDHFDAVMHYDLAWSPTRHEQRQGRVDRYGQPRSTAGAAYGSLNESMSSLNAIDDTPITEVHRKEERYARLARSPEYRKARLAADAWCVAFVWKKTKTAPPPVTHEVFCRLLTAPEQVPEATCEEIARLAEQYNFLHWHLAFPDVFRVPSGDEEPENVQTGWSGGFDVVLGNPPWERIKLQEKEWFATYRPDIAAASNAAERRHLINTLSTEDPALYGAFLEARRQAEGESHLVRASGRYPLCGRGDVNTYTIFAETNRIVIAHTGRVGCIVPSGIATDDTTKYVFQDLMQTRSLASLYDFENHESIFPGVRSYKFCLLTLTGAERPAVLGAEFVFFAHSVTDLHDEQRRFTLAAEDLALLNPNTRTCPVFGCKHDAELTRAIYRRVPVLIKEGSPEENPWGIRFSRMFDMSNDSSLFRTREQLEAKG
jgi:hypothetical protein